jgi:hypothetical protein
MIPQCGSGVLLAVDAAPLEIRITSHTNSSKVPGR